MKEIKAQISIEVKEDPKDVAKMEHWHDVNAYFVFATLFAGVFLLIAAFCHYWTAVIASAALIIFLIAILIIRHNNPPVEDDGINYTPTSYGAC